eukprot:TRINITY_DN865_c0_g2_i14.p1 TRINITY_DN865_c0_g2~~TRINITY_DN865_c0_g2_i14.p1  ORF type:complete len:282 (-),score=44.02 TRINITY_DN865_c0_g2_i14:379-1224(-)
MEFMLTICFRGVSMRTDSFSLKRFHDPGSVLIMASLFKAFLKDLPDSLIPLSHTNTAIEIVKNHFNLSTLILSRETRNYRSAVGSMKGEEIWFRLWQNTSLYKATQLESLAKLTEEYSIHISHTNSHDQLLKWLEDLPIVHRNCLEYICVFLCHLNFSSKATGTSLKKLSITFVPYLFKDPIWEVDEEDEKRTVYLKSIFIQLLLKLFQTKYSLNDEDYSQKKKKTRKSIHEFIEPTSVPTQTSRVKVGSCARHQQQEAISWQHHYKFVRNRKAISSLPTQ